MIAQLRRLSSNSAVRDLTCCISATVPKIKPLVATKGGKSRNLAKIGRSFGDGFPLQNRRLWGR